MDSIALPAWGIPDVARVCGGCFILESQLVPMMLAGWDFGGSHLQLSADERSITWLTWHAGAPKLRSEDMLDVAAVELCGAGCGLSLKVRGEWFIFKGDRRSQPAAQVWVVALNQLRQLHLQRCGARSKHGDPPRRRDEEFLTKSLLEALKRRQARLIEAQGMFHIADVAAQQSKGYLPIGGTPAKNGGRRPRSKRRSNADANRYRSVSRAAR